LAGTSGIIDPGVSSMKLASWVVVTGVMVVVAHAHAEPRLRVAGAKDGTISLTLRDGLVLSRTVRVVADTASQRRTSSSRSRRSRSPAVARPR
jgi:hypothetical protein